MLFEVLRVIKRNEDASMWPVNVEGVSCPFVFFARFRKNSWETFFNCLHLLVYSQYNFLLRGIFQSKNFSEVFHSEELSKKSWRLQHGALRTLINCATKFEVLGTEMFFEKPRINANHDTSSSDFNSYPISPA